MSPTPNLKNKLRAATLGKSRGFRKTLVEVAELGDDGAPLIVEVREPNVSQHSRILSDAGLSGGDVSKLDHARMQVAAVIACSFVPGTDEKVFDETDRAALLELPAGGWLAQLAQAAIAYLSPDEGAASKNSEGTASA